MVHITGGGFYDNIPRALPDDMAVEIDSSAWKMPVIPACGSGATWTGKSPVPSA